MNDMLLPGDRLEWAKTYISVTFGGKRKVLSTSPWNGGLRCDLEAVFNYDGKGEQGNVRTTYADTLEEHLRIAARRDVHLKPETCTGLMTAADMKNAAVCTQRYAELSVSAVVTGGIEVNGGRVGETSEWYECSGHFQRIPGGGPEDKPGPGTINILLFLDANLMDGTMERALVTCTEAKSAALQELCISSRYSSGLATGSGTDGTIIVSNLDSPIVLTEAGKHCKLGELIGKAVKQAVKEALRKQTGVDADRQHDAFRRLERFGFTPEALWDYAKRQGVESAADQDSFFQKVRAWAAGEDAVFWSILEAHLLDQYQWGLISAEELQNAERRIMHDFQTGGECDKYMICGHFILGDRTD